MGDSAQHGPPTAVPRMVRPLVWQQYRESCGSGEEADYPPRSRTVASGIRISRPCRFGTNGHANVAFCDGHVISIGRIGELKQKNSLLELLNTDELKCTHEPYVDSERADGRMVGPRFLVAASA